MATTNPSVAADIARPWKRFTQRQRNRALAILFLVSTSNYTDRQVISILIQPIKEEFKVSDTMIGLLTGFSFALCYALCGLPIAWLADRHNRPRIIAASVALWSVMTMLGGTVTSFGQLLLTRAGVGIGEAGAIPPAQSLIADYFPPEQRARALGVFLLSPTIAYLMAFLLGSRIALDFGWRTVLVVFGLPGLFLAVLMAFGVREPRARLETGTPRSSETLGATLSALAHKPTYIASVASMVMFFIVCYGALIWVPTYLVRTRGVDIAYVGATFGVYQAAVSVLGIWLGGILADAVTKRDVRWLALAPGLMLTAVYPFYLAALSTTTIFQFILFTFPADLAVGAATPAMFAVLHRVCGSPRRAMAVAIAFAMSNLIGLGLGPLATGAISDHMTKLYGGNSGLHYALVIMTAMFVPTGLLLCLASRTLVRDEED